MPLIFLAFTGGALAGVFGFGESDTAKAVKWVMIAVALVYGFKFARGVGLVK